MESQLKAKDISFCCKVVVMGGSKVGKSSLIESLVNDDGIDCRKSFHPLFQTKTLEYKEKLYSVNVWDSTNTDSVNSINKVYYRDANIILLCHDLKLGDRSLPAIELWYSKISQSTQPKCGNKT